MRSRVIHHGNARNLLFRSRDLFQKLRSLCTALDLACQGEVPVGRKRFLLGAKALDKTVCQARALTRRQFQQFGFEAFDWHAHK